MRALRLILEGLAGLCAALYLARWVFPVPGNSVLTGGPPAEQAMQLLGSIGLIAVTIAVLLRPKRLGWTLAAAAPVITVLTLPGSIVPSIRLPGALWVVLAGGLALGGIALAVADAAPPGRIAIAAGFAAGVVTGGPVSGLLLAGTRDRQIVLDTTRWYLIAIAVVLGVAALVALSRRGASDAPEAGWVAIAVCVTGGIALILGNRWLPTMSFVDGERRLDPYPWFALAVAIGLLFVWYAFRHGGLDAGRWTILALALAAPIGLGAPAGNEDAVPAALLIALAGLAAALGAALGMGGADRLAPWDAIGVLAASGGWLLGSPYVLHRTTGMAAPALYLLTAGTAFALAAGAARFWRSTGDGRAAHTALGLVLVVLMTAALAVPAGFEAASGPAWGQATPVPVHALGLACAIALAVLFGANRKRLDLSRERPGAPLRA